MRGEMCCAKRRVFVRFIVTPRQVFVLGAFWTQRQGAAYVCLRVVGAVRTLLTMARSTTAEHHAQVDAADRRLGTDADQRGMDLDFCARCLLLCICIRKGALDFCATTRTLLTLAQGA